MSTFKNIEDPFGSDDEDFSMMRKEWSKLDVGMKNAGIREGLESGQEKTLQNGFNIAFKDALAMAISAGELSGGISALLSCPSQDLRPFRDSTSHTFPTDQEAQLHKLLSSNTKFMTGIPSLLQRDVVQNIATNLGHIEDQALVTPCCNKTSNPSPHSVPSCDAGIVSLLMNESKSSEKSEEKTMATCKEVCSSKTSFWNQLESFKLQAESLGVISSSCSTK